jgi:hypothetical protein
MNLQNIVQWSRGRNSPVPRSTNESPVFALHREMEAQRQVRRIAIG